MRAILFTGDLKSYLYSKVAGQWNESAFYDRFSCVRVGDIAPQRLPGPDWVRVKVRYSGICGSDVNLLRLHDSPSTSPFASFPFVIGHENIGQIDEVGSGVNSSDRARGVAVGRRVVVDPVLSCEQRGFTEPCENCRKGEYSRCLNFAGGCISPGMLIGACRDSGGGWSENFVCHKSQVLPIPDHVTDEQAVMVDALCSSLRPVLRNLPPDNATALVIGSGVIGIAAVAALRALGSRCRIVAVARYPFQGELAAAYGADVVVRSSRQWQEYYRQLARLLDADLLKPMLGKDVVRGGADVVFDCVGSATTIDDALRFTKPGGRMVLVGLAAFPKGIDWTPIWLKEVTVAGSFAYGSEDWEGRQVRTYQLGLDLMSTGKVDLSRLVTHRFPLSAYRDAFRTVMDKGRSGVLKAVFYPD